MSDNGSKGSDPTKAERGAEHGGLGRYTSEAARSRALANLKPARTSAEAAQLGQFSGSARRDRAQFRHELNKLLDRRVKGERRTMREKAAATLIDLAVRGRDVAALRVLIERCDGPIDLDDYVSPERIPVICVRLNVPRFGPDGEEIVPPVPPPLHE